MKKNMGSADRVIRLILAAVFVILIWTGSVSGIVAAILGILAIIFLLTGLIGFCPLYALLKMSTIKKF